MKKSLIVFLLSAVIIGGLWYESPVKAERDRIPVEIYECVEKNIVTSVFLTGYVESSQETSVFLSETAEIKENYVETGDSVKKDNILFTAEVTDNHADYFTGNDVVSVMNSIGSMSHADMLTCEPDENGQFIVKSPIDGIIKNSYAVENNTIGIGMPCITIMSPENLQIRASVPEEYIKSIEKNMDCIITGSAFDKTYHGSIENIMPYAKTESLLTGKNDTVVDMIITIDDADDMLRDGYSAKIEVITGNIENTVSVPYSAVDQDEYGNEFVYIYNDGFANKRYITTGIELTDQVEVTSGLNVNEKIILSTKNIEQGSKVRAAEDEKT